MKSHALNEHCKKTYASEKLEKLEENAKKKIKLALDIQVPTDETKCKKTSKEKAIDIDLLVYNIKKTIYI